MNSREQRIDAVEQVFLARKDKETSNENDRLAREVVHALDNGMSPAAVHVLVTRCIRAQRNLDVLHTRRLSAGDYITRDGKWRIRKTAQGWVISPPWELTIVANAEHVQEIQLQEAGLHHHALPSLQEAKERLQDMLLMAP